MIYETLVNTLVKTGARMATKYISPSEVVRASRRCYRHKKGKPDKEKIEVVLTHGKPNYLEREFIRLAKKAGEPFPVRKIQLKFPANA